MSDSIIMLKGNPKVVLVGAGNLATRLGISLQEKGLPVVQVYSRTEASASALGSCLHVPYTISLDEITKEADIYIFSLKDDALPDVLKHFPRVRGLLVHTAGSVPMDIFQVYTNRYGVMYPLQTFSKNKDVSFDSIPVFVEANTLQDEELLFQFASLLSEKVQVLSSEKRKYLHLAAVFACNFSNHMYTIASGILKEQGLNWDLLLPLIRETAEKVGTMSPEEAQTGPAVRFDEVVINKQLKLLEENKNIRELYWLISKSIYKNS